MYRNYTWDYVLLFRDRRGPHQFGPSLLLLLHGDESGCSEFLIYYTHIPGQQLDLHSSERESAGCPSGTSAGDGDIWNFRGSSGKKAEQQN